MKHTSRLALRGAAAHGFSGVPPLTLDGGQHPPALLTASEALPPPDARSSRISSFRAPGVLRDLSSFALPGDVPSQNADALVHYATLAAAAGETELASLSAKQLQKLYRLSIENPVARVDATAKYDPTGVIGFCFGRSMTAHLIARQMGLQPGAIAKLFIIGDLRSDPSKPEWRFHVTTVVLGRDGEWYAIDPIMHNGRDFTPLKVAEWMRAVRDGWDSWQEGGAKARFFLTAPEAVLPDITVLSEPEDGTRIIQLNFNPEQHGIVADHSALKKFRVGDSRESIYVLNRDQSAAHFITPDEPPETRFNFIQISINGEVIPYNNYFVDLLRSLQGAGRGQPVSGTQRQSNATPMMIAPVKAGGSFNLNQILHDPTR